MSEAFNERFTPQLRGDLVEASVEVLCPFVPCIASTILADNPQADAEAVVLAPGHHALDLTVD